MWIATIMALGGCKKAEEPPTPAPATPPWGFATRPANPTCLAPQRPVVDAAVQLVQPFNVRPTLAIALAQPPGDPDWWWLATQRGTIYRFRNQPGVDSWEIVVELGDKVDDDPNEGGLLGMAFHPDFATNGQVYLDYTAPSTTAELTTTVSRFTSSDGATLDLASEQILLTVDQPYGNHNGGHVVFGPDGYLYIGLGDGGFAGDPQGNGQNTNTLLGSILRIDVDGGSPYAIPPDNPFAAGGGAPEIYAWGLRNPWRFSFDPLNGDLWVGDVGQDTLEEIDVVERGGNYGWNTMEGDACHDPVADCDPTGLQPPIAVLPHTGGDQSITGGVVYRGALIPALQGLYVFADYVSGRLYSVTYDPVTGAPVTELLLETGRKFTHFAHGLDGEVYLLDHNSGIWRLEPAAVAPPADPFPEWLSQTGCFDPADPSRPGSMLIPFTVAHPFWSDGADKERYLAIPDGTEITVGPDGILQLPVGSVTVKSFDVGGKRVETRLMVRHEDGFWAGYAYAWEGTDARLLPAAATVEDGAGANWAIPSRPECLQCHTDVAGGTLGLTLQQLDLETTYANGATVNQLDQLEHIGLLDAGEGPGPFPAIDDAGASIEDRARAYLHVNCGYCHQEGGTGGGDLDLRAQVPLAEAGLCDPPSQGDLGIPDARIVAPGDPARSVLLWRMSTRDTTQMPPLATVEVDSAGTDLIESWIAEMERCP